jgi:hypothetical protein
MADYAKLIEAKKWSKLEKIATGKKMDEVKAVAEALGNTKHQEAYNILVEIMMRPETEAKIAGVKGLAGCRYDVGSQITRIIWLQDNGGREIPELNDAIIESLRILREAKK